MSGRDTDMTRKPPDSRSHGGPDAPLDALQDALGDVREAVQRAERAARDAEDASREGGAEPVPESPPSWTWRAKLWCCPAETRLGVEELSEAVGRSSSWIYQRTRSDADDPIPHRKLAGSLQFVAGEVRHWIRSHEEAPVQGPSWSPADGGLGVLEESA